MRGLKGRRKKFDIVTAVIVVIFTVYAFTLLYPFFYLIINSLKSALGFLTNPLGMGGDLSLDNYWGVITNLPELTGMENLSMGSMFFHSITLSVGSTVVSMFMQAMAAYVLAKYEFKGNDLIYIVIIVASMIPTVGSLTATFKLMTNTGLSNTYIGMLLLQGGAFGGCFLYLHAYFKSIPWSYAESAMIDGASDFMIFVKIMLPLASKAILTYSILCFLGFWNDYWIPSLFYDQRPTLAVGLKHISAVATNTGNYPMQFAAMIITIIPVLILYAVMQKQLLGSLTAGGLKE